MSVMLAKNWAGSDPAGWWMSEKLDGIRAVWDGVSLTTRTGHAILAPESFVAALPAGVSLDGELWLGRGQFQRMTAAYRVRDSVEWRRVRYAVFDSPAAQGGFEERQRVLADVLAGKSGPAFVLDQRKCVGRDDLDEHLAKIVRAGGEGVMLREPGSEYARRRSASLLKVKPVHDDEAKVIAYQPGTGRNRSAVGALVAQLPDGTVFRISSGLSDAMRRSPPAVGAAVTFRHHDYTDAGVPRFPSFVRLA